VSRYPFAVFAPHLGARSETFIRRHVQDLLPGRTVAVVGTASGTYAGHWAVDCPVLVLDAFQSTLPSRIVRGMARRVGVRVSDPTDRNVERFLTRHNVKVVMGEYLHVGLPCLTIAKRLGIRFCGHAHGYDVSSLLRDPKWRADYLRYNDSDGVITMSQVNRKRLIALGIHESTIHVIPYGVDVPSSPTVRAPNQVVRCLAVGRMVTKKAPILMVDAFRRAVDACPHLRLDVVGEGALLPAVQQFVRAFDLGDRVTLHRGQPSEVVQRLMRDADMFLQHSITDEETGDEEGLPVAILEAMAQGLPIVSTRHAGIPEAVAEGESGYLVDEGDSTRMAEWVIALARDPDLRRRLGMAGWQRARECFTWEKERVNLLKVLGLS
jgi:colanic acid/amylovoran biosynthesis glycosyltransferase